jgi:hypothetical protein
MEVTCLGLDQSELCDDFLHRNDNALIHYSGAYMRFLSRAIPKAELQYFSAFDGDRLIGVVPFARLNDPKLGTAINSLPFFGSHGGVLVDNDLPDGGSGVLNSLYESFLAESQSCGAATVTVIENSFSPLSNSAISRLNIDVVDDRIGQITSLPAGGDTEEKLFASFHVKTRNAIRKGQKSGQIIELCENVENLAWLQCVHEQSIRSLGGVPKTLEIFESLIAEFPLGTSSRLYVGRIDGEPVSGLLLLLYQDMVEYFTPVVVEEHRDKQVLSGLIFRAMTELAKEGYRVWNWGGTWRSQEGVYRFKSRWGAAERPYRYFNRLTDSNFKSHSREVLTQAFPFFYLFKY